MKDDKGAFISHTVETHEAWGSKSIGPTRTVRVWFRVSYVSPETKISWLEMPRPSLRLLDREPEPRAAPKQEPVPQKPAQKWIDRPSRRREEKAEQWPIGKLVRVPHTLAELRSMLADYVVRSFLINGCRHSRLFRLAEAIGIQSETEREVWFE